MCDTDNGAELQVNGLGAARIAELEARVRHLEEANQLTLEALELAGSLGDFQSSISSFKDPLSVLRDTSARIRRLIPFWATAFFLVNEADQDFILAHADPEESVSYIEGEVEHLIESRYVSWALSRNKPVHAITRDARNDILLHRMATSARTRGLFVGVMRNLGEVPDTSLAILSITLRHAAGAIESCELYRLVREINRELKSRLEEMLEAEAQAALEAGSQGSDPSSRPKSTEDGSTRFLSDIVGRLEAEALGRMSAEDEGERARRALKRVEDKYRAFFENAIEGIFQFLPGGGVSSANPALARILGYDSPGRLKVELVDVSSQLFATPEEAERLMEAVTSQGSVKRLETQVRRKDGQLIWVVINARLVREDDGQALFVEGTMEDITEHKTAELSLKRQALFDDLTGLPNRSFFFERFRSSLDTARRTGDKMALLYLDLDDFKLVNDTHGHHVGDVLLSLFAGALKGCVRNSDFVARMGGDEFIVLLSSVRDREDAILVAEKIKACLVPPFIIDGHQVKVGVSVGNSLYPEDGDSLEALIRHADGAMYQCKTKNNA